MEETSPEESSSKKDKKCQPQDFISILQDDIFIFTIGDEQKRFNVHIAALKNISEPLGIMMTNGKMEESINKKAVLSDVDPIVFGLLVEYAYKGLCAIPQTPSSGTACSTELIPLPTIFHCHNCGYVQNMAMRDNPYPFCSSICQENHDTPQNYIPRKSRKSLNTEVRCVSCGGFTRSRGENMLCSLCFESLGSTNTYPNLLEVVKARSCSTSMCGPTFTSKQYNPPTLTHKKLHDCIKRHSQLGSTSNIDTPTLLHYAKLYALATKYMIPNLPELCLYKLHAHLVIFKIDEKSIDQLVELVLYAYENTSDEGSIVDGTGDELRDLVIRYVVDRTKDVMRYKRFREGVMLGAGSLPVVDFMAVTYGKADF